MRCGTARNHCIIAFVMAFAPSSATGALIDDFAQGDVTLTDPLGLGSVSELVTGLDPEHTAARARHITFNANDPFPFGDTGNVTVAVSGESLRHSPDPGLTAANFFISYGVTSLGMPPMSLDLSANGENALALDFESAMIDASLPAGTFFSYDLRMKSANGSSLGAGESFSVSESPFTVILPFAAMTNVQPFGSAFDFSRVTEIRIGTSNGTFRGPFELTAIRTVPEPASLPMLLLVCVTAMCRTRRLHRYQFALSKRIAA